MRTFAGWVTGRPYRLVLVTIVLFQLIPAGSAALLSLSVALLTLDSLKRGPAAGTISALLVLGAIALIAVVEGAGAGQLLGLAAPLLLGGVLMGTVLGRSHSLSLTYQVTVVIAILGTAAAVTFVPAVSQIGESLHAALLDFFRALGVTDADLANLSDAISPEELMRIWFASWQLVLLAGLMLGYWWFTLITDGATFGADFRGLRLGRIAGLALMLLVALGQLKSSGLISTLAPMGVGAFLFQGLAVVHARRHSDNWPRAVLIFMYVVLFSPLTFLAILGLSGIGLLDNVFALRAETRSGN